jgi:hypothetical protein
VGGTTSDDHNSHEVSWSAYGVDFTATYTHSDDQYGIYTTGYLPLCEEYFHTHDYGTVWCCDEINHWRECGCGVQESVSVHDTFTNPATCSQKAVCPVCDIEVGEIGDHAFNQRVVDEKYLCNNASCTSPATYFYTCECGLVGENTFEIGSISHSYGDDGVCVLCGVGSTDTNVGQTPDSGGTTTPSGGDGDDSAPPETSNPDEGDGDTDKRPDENSNAGNNTDPDAGVGTVPENNNKPASTPNNNQLTNQTSRPVSDDTVPGVTLVESKVSVLLKAIWTLLSIIFGFHITWV